MLRVALVFAALCAMVAVTGVVRGAVDRGGDAATGPVPAAMTAPARQRGGAGDE